MKTSVPLPLIRWSIAFTALALSASAIAQRTGDADASGNAHVSAAHTAPTAQSKTQPAALPANGTFQVEVVVFENSGATDNDNAPVAPRGFGTTSTHQSAARVIHVLGADAFKLGNVDATLRAHAIGKVIAHAAWIQGAAPWGSHSATQLSSVGITTPGLSGATFLERAPMFLHLGFDLHLTHGATTYTITDMRAIRLSEWQYFDQSHFGVLALVTRMGAPTPTAAPAATH